jgi:RNase P protein component
MASDEDRPGAWRSLRKRSEFERIYRAGTKFVGRHCVLYLLWGENNARAFVASRKVGGAVRRNRAKRLMRAGLVQSGLTDESGVALARRRCAPPASDPAANPNLASGLWIVIVARSSILSVSSREVAAELAGLLGENG